MQINRDKKFQFNNGCYYITTGNYRTACKQRGMFAPPLCYDGIVKNRVFSSVDMLLFLPDFPDFQRSF